MKISQENLYKRQIILPEIGLKGQRQMSGSKIAIIGCGGLGSTAAVYLAASGIGHLHLIDYDTIDISNLHRQVFYGQEDIGKPKAGILANHIARISPFVKVTFSDEPITKSTIEKELNEFSLILDCTDSLTTKYLLNDFCVLSDKILVYGSLYKHDGYVASFNLPYEGKRTANLRDAFPSIPNEHIPNCAEIGTLNTIVGIIAMMQANEVIKIITNTGEPLMNQVLIYNIMENSQFSMRLKNEVSKEKILNIYRKQNYFDARCEVQDSDLLMVAEDLKKRLMDPKLAILSVIEDVNTTLPLKVDYKIPLSEFDISKIDLDENKELVVLCAKGISSYTVTKQIKKQFPKIKVFSLKNGIENF